MLTKFSNFVDLQTSSILHSGSTISTTERTKSDISIVWYWWFGGWSSIGSSNTVISGGVIEN